MNTPILSQLSRLDAVRQGLPQALCGRGVVLFRVERGGAVLGRSWRQGEVVVVDGEQGEGLTVLCPRGRGRMQLGEVLDGQLLGDAGERRSGLRWSAAGQVRAVARPAGAYWSVEAVGEEQPAFEQQLSLFAA